MPVLGKRCSTRRPHPACPLRPPCPPCPPHPASGHGAPPTHRHL